ncbi:hypothetical protein [Phragmitibacter flavus]|nr:hypothetical protein [Phragmitibacter flavus]
MPPNPRDEVEIGRTTPAKGVVLSSEMPLILFCTICADQRGSWVARREVMELLHDIWSNEATAWLVGPYVLMPDHLHFLCVPKDLRQGIDIEKWTAFWKQRFSRRIGQPEWRWQRGIFHHRLRNDAQLQEKLEYMQENPVVKNLADKSNSWPWRGEVHDLHMAMNSFHQPSPSKQR